MTKHINIDEILEGLKTGTGLAGWKSHAKQQLYDLMLEIIGEDEPRNVSLPPKGFSNTRFDLSVPKNNLRQEQRQKANDLFKGDKE